MSKPKNPNPQAITEAGAVELDESELNAVSGGPAFMKLGDIKGEVVDSKINVANNLAIKLAQGK